jgi:excinuclease ABC subunit A
LSGAASLPSLARRSVDRARAIRLRGATRNGLRDVDLLVPVGCLTTVTGPSGSGKSSLIMGSLVPAIRAAIAARPTRKGEAARVPRLPSWIAALEGAEAIDRIVAIDQEPLGRSPRATPATATGIMPRLRELFAGLPEAQARGFKPGRFSTNVKGGRCEACLGDGVVRVEMRFLPDVFVECAVCRGARYDRETLEIRWKGHSIAEVLAANVDDCHRLFESVPPIRERLDAMRAVGLGYLALGQPSTTLSGGEAQRVKLARELARARETRARDRGRTEGSTLFVFDEPTTGLHPVDVAILLEAIAALRDEGSTIVVVEHDAAFAARADHVIDLGPGAGPEGGRIVAAGTPEEVANSAGAPTAFALARVLDHGARDADHTPTSPSRMP